MRRPTGYWKNKQNVIDALTPYVIELGYIPSLPEIKKLESGLAGAINRYYPMEIVYSWFGKENDYKFKDRKQAGYWQNKDNVIRIFEEIINKVGEIPSANKLIEMGYQDLVSAISRHYKLTEIRTWFGRENENKKDRSNYNNVELVYKEIRKCIEESESIPTIDDLKKKGKSYLIKLIYRKHGTKYSTILKELGVEANKKDKGYWQKTENIIQEAKIIINEFGFLPSQRKLDNDNRYQSFCVAVTKIYGGFRKLREDLGLEQLKKAQGYWNDEQALLTEIEIIIDKYGYIPTYLHKRGYASLENALQYYGGVYAFAKKHNLPLQNTRIPYTYYDDEDRLNEKINELIKEFKDFPSFTELIHSGEYAIINRLCNKYGSITNASLAYGFERNLIKSLDGHFCDSFSERIVDDYLFCCNVSHERNIKLQLGKVNVVPDFILSEKVVIEVLMCDYSSPARNDIYETYIKRYIEKRKAYLENNFILIEVFPEDLRSKTILDSKLYNLVKGFASSPIRDLSKVPLSKKTKRPPGYWKVFENVKIELLPHIHKLGRMPTPIELKEMGIGHIQNIARKYHGGLKNIANKLEVINLQR